MTPLIQDPTTPRKLQRGFRLTEMPDGILAPEIVGVVLLEDWTAPLSDLSRGCMGSAVAGAVAAENALVVLTRVGAPARYDLIVTEAYFNSTTSGTIALAIPTAGVVGLTTSGNSTFTDLELPGRPTSDLGFDTQVAIPANRSIRRYAVIANTTYRIPLNMRLGTIGKGADLTAIMLVAESVNTQLRAGFSWTESGPLG